MQKHLRITATLLILLATCTLTQAGEYDLLSTGANELLYNDLIVDMNTLYDQRKVVVQESLQSLEALQTRQTQLQNDFKSLVGYVPEEKNPLNAEVTGTVTIPGQNYTIEKIVYESRPGHHVTANLYLPTSASETNQVPGVLVTCGHSNLDSKAYEGYQKACILMAQNGMAALIFDPPGQGERAQIYDSPQGTTEHTMMGVGARALGMNAATYEIYDGVRSLDYLISRPEVNGDLIGLAGNSGGGTQTAWLMAYDDRIDVATPSCFISTMKATVEAIGPQDCEQHFANQGKLLIEHADFLTMRAPKPTRILAAEQDFFPIAGTRETYAESQAVYSLMGAADAVDLFTYDDQHGWSQPRREASVQWLKQWLLNDASPVSEPADQPVQTRETLLCTSTGQVKTSYTNEKNVADLNLEHALELQTQRDNYWATHTDAECREMVAGYLDLPEDRGGKNVNSFGTIDREGYTIEKLLITRNSEVPVPALLFKPDNVTSDLPATVYIDGNGKAASAGVGGDIESIVTSGQIVISVDLSGFGETFDDTDRNEQYNNEECNNSYIAQYIGDSLVARRVEDVMLSIDVLLEQPNIDETQINLVGVGRASTAVMHAAALDTRVDHVDLKDPNITSWIDDVVRKPLASNLLGHIVPGALNHYDLPDLQRLMPNSVIPEPEPFTPTLYRWKFDGNFNEESGQFNGTVVGNPTLGTTSGAFTGSGAVHFDGDNDAVSISKDILGDSSFTIAFWAKTDAGGTTGYYFSDSANANNLFARRFDASGDSRLSGWIDEINFGNLGPDGTETGSWEFGVWNHHVIVYDEELGKQNWYVNGKLLKSMTAADFDGLTSEFYLGNRQDLLRDFKGWIDDLQIYNWAVDPEKAKSLFENPGTTVSPFVPGDANMDGKVDGSDVTILAGNWQLQSGATWAMGDFNGDGRVDGSDVTILAGNWQYGTSGTATAVPEPSTSVLLAFGAFSLLTRLGGK